MDPEKKQIWKKRIVLASAAFKKYGMPILRCVCMVCVAILSVMIIKQPFRMEIVEETYNIMLGGFFLVFFSWVLFRKRD